MLIAGSTVAVVVIRSGILKVDADIPVSVRPGNEFQDVRNIGECCKLTCLVELVVPVFGGMGGIHLTHNITIYHRPGLTIYSVNPSAPE